MSWLAEAFADLRQRIQDRWTDYRNGDPHEAKERPYIMDELLRPSTWLVLGLYPIVALLIVWIFHTPGWVVLALVGGMGLLFSVLIWEKIVFSSYVKPQKPPAG